VYELRIAPALCGVVPESEQETRHETAKAAQAHLKTLAQHAGRALRANLYVFRCGGWYFLQVMNAKGKSVAA
jgi:hypothetical protein